MFTEYKKRNQLIYRKMATEVLSIRVLADVKTRYQEAFELSGCTTPTSFLETILEAYQNPKTKTVPTPTDEQAEALQLKENEIGRLKTALDFANEQIEISGNNNSEWRKKAAELETENEILKQGNQQQPAAVELTKDQVIVNLSPVMSVVLNIESELASKRNKKDITRAQILENCFYATIEDGRYDPHRYWSRSELRQIATQIKESEPQQ